MRKYNQALKFVERAERYAKDRRRMAGDGEAVAGYILNCAERVQSLDKRMLSDDVREQLLARIWSAYQVATDWLESRAPHHLDCPERYFYGDMLDQGFGSGGDWDGCPEQVRVDADYHGVDD